MRSKFFWFATSILTIIIVCAVCVGGYYGFRKYKIDRYTQMGDIAMESGNWALARLWYFKVLEKDSQNLTVLSRLTNNAGSFKDPDHFRFLKMREKVEPESDEVKLGIVNVLLGQNKTDQAKEYLDRIPHDTEFQTQYTNMYSAYYVTLGEYGEAEAFARKSLESSPDSVNLKANLLSILLKREKPDSIDEINTIVEDLRSDEKNDPIVWRVSLGYSLSKQAWDNAVTLSEKLAKHPDAPWYEKTGYLKLLSQFDPEKVEPYLMSVSEANPAMLEEVSRILNHTNRSEFLLTWLDLLEANGYQMDLSFEIAKADAFQNLGEWNSLLTYIESKDWQYFDYYRHILLSLAYDSLNQKFESQKAWNEAMLLARESALPEQIRIVNLLKNWPVFEGRRLDLLEEMLMNEVHAEWAYGELFRFYYDLGATHELYRISKKALNKLPDNAEIKNGAIMEGLLLNDKVEGQLELAKENYDKYPGKPIPTSTYAFALHKNGMYEEAYNVFMGLDEKFFQIAEVAHYAAVVCKGAGKMDDYQKFAKLAKNATLLPEERALLD